MAEVIRNAEVKDLEALGELGAMLMQTHFDFDPKRFLEPGGGASRGYARFLGSLLDAEDGQIFVAEEEGAVTGYVYVALEPLSWKELRGPAGFIHDLAVTAAARRTGTATRLMETALAWLRERNAPRVLLWTAAPNASAQALFARLGFRETMRELTLEL